MTQRTGTTNEMRKDEIYTCLAHHRRRRILAFLDDRSSLVSDTELATRIGAAESNVALEDVSENDARSILVELNHTHLPRLVDAGFVTWNRDAGTVAGGDREMTEDPIVAPHLESFDESRDRLFSALAHRRRRLALSLLDRRESETPITREELATSMIACERAMGLETENGSEAADQLATKLYHQHLPKLEDAGLVTYDRDDETISDTGHLDVDAEWCDGTVDDPRRPVLEISPLQASY
ncbi:DUF7344 domain-containing protein [Halomontanus rarus]|uniref:DUF7344 domain-containing protein n=1 Tax=Halomontanus rarus TaxID=3034020 RepID=UPI0023E8016C|nr:hypothetical protein [Halovivax sp. TS33]